MACGCVQRLVQLRSDPQNPLASQLQLYASGGPRPSERTEQLLRRYDLPTRFGASGTQTLSALETIHRSQPQPETAYALAELNYIAARKAEFAHRSRAQDQYLSAVAYAYEYLFDGRYDTRRNVYDPQFRGACDLYNAALEECLRIAQAEGNFRPGHTLALATAGRQVEVTIESRGFNWLAQDFDSFKFVSDFDVVGLKNRHRTSGLGVPLIAVRRTGTAPPDVERYYPRGFSFPVTAFLRLDPHEPGSRRLSVRLELYDPLEVTDVHVADRRVPLESDISTPLAYFLDNPSLAHLDTFGLLRPDLARRIAGLYMVQPYQPGKIPVLMVHGIWSSPMTWMEVLNDLRAMPEIRERYQFWFYLYPTGVPFHETAAALREDLAEVQAVFGRERHDPTLGQMVLVGHSMGGLISRMVTLDSGDDYWQTVSDRPFAAVNAPPELKESIRRVYFFESDRAVRRVVTIGSPHRGSAYAAGFLRLLAQRFIALPMQTLASARQLIERNPDAFRPGAAPVGRTAVDSLSPENPILQVMLRSPKPSGVKYHNVVGAIVPDRPLTENTDGVVTYASAHVDDVESEVVVDAEHSSLHRHPRTILEIRRILLEHLDDLRAQPDEGVVPAGHTDE